MQCVDYSTPNRYYFEIVFFFTLLSEYSTGETGEGNIIPVITTFLDVLWKLIKHEM